MRRRAARLLAAALVALPAAAHGAAWTLERGETKGYVTSSFTYGDHGYDSDGNLIAVPEYRKFVLSGTVEHGVRPWLTAIVRGELREEGRREEITPTLIGPVTRTYGSVGGGARIRLYQTPAWVISTEFTAFSGGMDTSGIAAPADGPGVEVRVLAGTGREVLGRPMFANIETAYRHRLEDDEPDELKLDLTLGARAGPSSRRPFPPGTSAAPMPARTTRWAPASSAASASASRWRWAASPPSTAATRSRNTAARSASGTTSDGCRPGLGLLGHYAGAAAVRAPKIAEPTRTQRAPCRIASG